MFDPNLVDHVSCWLAEKTDRDKGVLFQIYTCTKDPISCLSIGSLIFSLVSLAWCCVFLLRLICNIISIYWCIWQEEIILQWGSNVLHFISDFWDWLQLTEQYALHCTFCAQCKYLRRPNAYLSNFKYMKLLQSINNLLTVECATPYRLAKCSSGWIFSLICNIFSIYWCIWQGKKNSAVGQ